MRRRAAIKSVQHYISTVIGLDPSIFSAEVWQRLVHERMAMTGSAGFENYFQLLKSSPFEFQELVEQLLVTETWFFRNKPAIDTVVKKCASAEPGKITRILSLACSTGEEPFSIVMALLDAKIKPQQFSVDACDLSKKALSKATCALYDKNSFRERDNTFLDRYFSPKGDAYELTPKVRNLVQFHYGNILDKTLVRAYPPYDVILCRNVLLYLTPEARRIALGNIKSWLAVDGILIVTAPETEAVRKQGFMSVTEGPTYVLNKPTPKQTGNAAQKVEEIRLEELKESPKDLNEQIDYIREMADQGDFAAAKKLCLRYIDKHLLEGEGHFLLGVIEHALKNDQDAEVAFMKAIYLKPEHHEALVYMSLIEEGKGNEQQAKIYRERAERVLESKDK